MKEFDKIIGYSNEKKELEQIADTMVNRDAYKALGVKPPSGLLMHGVPGVGKTLMAKSLIEATGLPVFTCRKDQPNGEFVKTNKETFTEAVKNAPAIVFLDDVDKFANTDYNHRDADEFVTIQACIDENKDKEIFVLATANDMDKLPHSLRRAGRFDRVMHIGEPKGKDAVGIIEHYLSQKKFLSNVDAGLLGRIMDGRSCAQLETVINEAGILAGMERADTIGMNHILKACIKTVFEANVNVGRNYDDDYDDYDYDNGSGRDYMSKERIACHEVGHAVDSEVLFPGSVTIMAVTDGSTNTGGFTSCYTENETNLTWRKSRLATGLGGMAATEQLYGVEDLGDVQDINNVFGAVRSMISGTCAFGFDYKTFGYETSEARKQKVEELAGGIVEKYFRKAKEIIAKNREFFDKMMAELLEKEMLVEGDIARIRESCKITPVAVD